MAVDEYCFMYYVHYIQSPSTNTHENKKHFIFLLTLHIPKDISNFKIICPYFLQHFTGRSPCDSLQVEKSHRKP